MTRQIAQNHPALREMTRSVLAVPFAKQLARRTAKLAIQRSPLSKKNKQRVYNLIAAEAVPIRPVRCHVQLPGGGTISLELDLHDELSRRWYYWGYNGYEQSTVLLWAR